MWVVPMENLPVLICSYCVLFGGVYWTGEMQFEETRHVVSLAVDSFNKHVPVALVISLGGLQRNAIFNCIIWIF